MTRFALLFASLALLVSGTGCRPGPSGPPESLHTHPFLVCTRLHETPGNRVWPYDDGYTYGQRPGHIYMGAYQFRQSTWNSTAEHIGAWGLVDVPPNWASVEDQDNMAWQTYLWLGNAPWMGRC